MAGRMIGLVQAGTAIFLCVALASQQAAAQPAPECTPASQPICRIMAQPEFQSAYRTAYAQTADPADAVDDVRDNFRRAMVGSGQGGQAAVGRQIDAILDDALKQAQQRLCPRGEQSAAAVAAGLAAAAEARGTHLAPQTLGAMTGVVVGVTRTRGVACLCTARTFSAIRDSCAGSSPR